MLSDNARKSLEIACPQGNISDGSAGEEIAEAIDTGFNATPAADVAANSPAGAVTVTTSGGNTYSDSAINTALSTVVGDINSTRTQINAILTALKNAGLMS